MSFQQQILTYAPGYLRGKRVGTLLEAFGAALDSVAERVWQGRLAAIPYSGAARGLDGRPLQCEPDALQAHAADRGIRLYPTEPTASKRWRLSRWRQLHARRGTHRGEMEHAQPYFLPGRLPVIRIVHQVGDGESATWHKLNPLGVYSKQRIDPSNFSYDGQTAKWSRWGVFIEMDGSDFTAPNKYDDGHTYDDGAVYDAGGANPFTSAMAADVVQMFLDWHSAHSHLMFVVLVWGGTVDPTATATQDATGWWSLPAGKWGSDIDPVTHLGTRPPNMIWLYDNPG